MKLSNFVFLIAIFGSSTGAISKDCGLPPIRENAQLSGASDVETYTHGTEINYNCIVGYVGRLRYNCDNGEWKNVHKRFDCKLKPCGSPGDTLHSTFQLVEGEDLVFGARIEYTCDEGYRMVGTKNYRNCEATGWTGLVPYCEVQTCPAVKEPENGKIIVSGTFDLDQDFPFGSALQFECSSPHLEIQGAKEIYCLANGTWSNPVPQCKELECKIPTISNGRVVSKQRVFKYSQRLKYRCNRNYRPENIQQTTCGKFGWNPLPICSPIVCRITQIEHGNFLTSKWMYAHNEEVNYTCEKNYKPSRSGTVKCQASGWIPNPSCEETTCLLPNIQARFSTRYRPFKLMQRVNYICASSDGYKESTCTVNGWSPPIKCPGPCSAPPKIENGLFGHTGYSYPSGSKGNYRCNNQFKLQGNGEIKCIDGEWIISSSVPFCIARGCGKPPTLRNGGYNPNQARYNDGQWLTYKCDYGYELYGELHVACNSGWPEAPVCIDLQSNCPAPPEIHKGIIIDQSNYKVTYQCHSQYTLEGSPVIKCINGNWSGAPTCNDSADQNSGCGRPPAIENGDILSIMNHPFRHDDSVIYQCYNSYLMKGSHKVLCSHGKWLTAPRCLAPCMISEEDLRKNGVLLPWSFQKKIILKHGEHVTFTCPDGFQMKPPAERICNDGQMEIPKCLNEENKLCTPLQYYECPSCAHSEICVQYHIQKIATELTDASTLSLVAQRGSGNALFTVQNIHGRNSNSLTFSIKQSSNALVNIAFNNEPRSIQYNNPALGDYCLTFSTGNSIIFNVTFSGTFTIRFNNIKQNLE
ncbi:complement factor H-like [Cetorhinus maximus]